MGVQVFAGLAVGLLPDFDVCVLVGGREGECCFVGDPGWV